VSFLGEGWDALKRLATIDLALQHVEKSVVDLADEVREMARNVSDLKERVGRLEDARENDRLRIETELERFQLQVERFGLRVSSLNPPALPESPAPPSTDTN
jgi:predicted  nucleic acid-binding Zn-ribbon protein